MKKAFSLIEVVISITIAFFVIFALYQLLALVKQTGETSTKMVEDSEGINLFLKTIQMDLLTSSNVTTDSEKLLLISTDKSYYPKNETQNVIYLWDKEKKLIYRAESKKAHDIAQKTLIVPEFIDIVAKDIEYCEFKKDGNNVLIGYKVSNFPVKIFVVSTL